MKKIFSTLLITMSFISAQVAFAQQIAPLTNTDRENYIVSIDQQQLKTPVISNPGLATSRYYMNFELKITNNSNDTLKYMSMWCSWNDILRTDNEKFHISGNYCGSDHPQLERVPPHRTASLTLSIIIKKAALVPGTPFKVGISIYKFINKKLLKEFNPADPALKNNVAYIIWSNSVQIPK